MPSLETFLSTKPLFYAEIDYTRMPLAWKSIEKHIKLPRIIHIVGTNGKGSTGRFLAHYLYHSGFCVGHYSSPHIVDFNERIWLDGHDVADAELALYHDKLYQLLTPQMREALSFFEYTTLLAMLVFEQCDYVVLEAGLGGEYDATAVFSNLVTLVTPIDIDHRDFLGDTIADIAKTKLNATQKTAILARQTHEEVYAIANTLFENTKIMLFDSHAFFMQKELKEIEAFIKEEHFPNFLVNNLTLALATVKYLGFEVDMSNLHGVRLFGRCQKVEANVTIDVGHNALAATALAQHFKGEKLHLVFNTFADKDYVKTLKILKASIKVIEILPILNKRIEKQENLIKVIEALDIPYKMFEKIQESETYLVFGSFTVVETFLKQHAQTTKETQPS